MKWSPHSSDLFAIGSAANFGIVGTGAVHIKSIQANQIQTISVIE